MKNFGEVFQRERKRKRLKLSDLKEKIGLSISYLSDIEHGRKAAPKSEIVRKIEDLGAINIILLDLFKVGQKIGGIPALYFKIRDVFNGEILVGGGIKNIQDIEEYKSNNFSGALIGTALHDGSIKIEELRSFLEC